MKQEWKQLTPKKYKGLYENIMNNYMQTNCLEEMNKFLPTYHLPKLNQEE